MKIGIQSYTVREYCRNEKDLGQTLEKLAAIGYRNIQLSAVGPIEPKRVKALCDGNGLKIVLTHDPADAFLERTDEIIERQELYGCRYTGLGFLPEAYRTPEGLEKFGKDFGSVAQRLHDAGLKLMYHNHALEFARMPDGRTLMDHLLSMFPAELMGITADTYLLQYGGVDLYSWLREHAARLHCVHLKDYTVSGFEIRMAPVGRGNLDFRRILEILGENAACEYALVEQDDCYGEDPFDCLRESFAYLAALRRP